MSIFPSVLEPPLVKPWADTPMGLHFIKTAVAIGIVMASCKDGLPNAAVALAMDLSLPVVPSSVDILITTLCRVVDGLPLIVAAVAIGFPTARCH
jgi:hypothetical protein